ncbi:MULTISPECIES: hypothetical protein [Paenibacillus]|uniref:Uncharacterized protein n=1 Tax=Paenibacillus phytohabitans TaxID=2654978 RepID=A0ABX1YKY4_9BACL|nr:MULTISPECIES: hypothetical protein [Paenibacillus]AIQ32945.1 hypothetical protein P40081_36205 [Paenibacillus sp. FSL P4-0081]NOU81703.1 hypothetical protein [Paenibacillus phytohabitans]OMF28764.1 hypothetical protein BK132_12370 [Paenibacillus sp. FSL H8-0259]
MAKDENVKEPAVSRLFTPDGKPIRVLSTSLGIALLANALFIPGGAGASGSTGGTGDEPKLVSWSTEEVKNYFDKNVDWNIPYPDENQEETVQEGQGAVTSGGTTVINNYGGYNSGFGWDDVLLYHMLFNSGSFYSSRGWYNDRPTYYGGTRTAYKPPTYSSGSFQNKPVAGSVVKPKTSTSSTGSITRRKTSSKSGGIGGTSSGLGSGKSSSSTSKSSSSKSSGKSSSKSGFGG